MAEPSTLALITMSRAYTLTPRSKNVSTAATLLHSLRHDLRTRLARHSAFLTISSDAVRIESHQERPGSENEWPEDPTSPGPPYEVIEIEDKGEYSRQRYGNIDVYWNSVMVEASAEKQARRHVAEDCKKREKRNGRIFNNTAHLYQAYDSRHPNERSGTQSEAVLGQTSVLDDAASMPMQAYGLSNPAITEDRFIKLVENTSIADLGADRAASPTLTWNSALAQILANPGVDRSVSSAIRARARSKPSSDHEDDYEVDMCDVGMVPNFSYPLRNACWSGACHTLE